MRNAEKTTVAFIGLGNMGLPMAVNLQKAGYQVTGFDLSESACAQARTQGLTLAASAADAVQDAVFIVSMLPAGRHVAALYLGADGTPGLLSVINKDALIIDSSTIDIDSAVRVAQAAQHAGIAMLDAPVSGGTGGATAGTLTFMVGGDAAHLERAKPILVRAYQEG